MREGKEDVRRCQDRRRVVVEMDHNDTDTETPAAILCSSAARKRGDVGGNWVSDTAPSGKVGHVRTFLCPRRRWTFALELDLSTPPIPSVSLPKARRSSTRVTRRHLALTGRRNGSLLRFQNVSKQCRNRRRQHLSEPHRLRELPTEEKTGEFDPTALLNCINVEVD